MNTLLTLAHGRAAALVLASASAWAQEPASAPHAADGCSLVSCTGGWRADGPDYTATFARGGAVFAPAIGGDPSRAFPIRLATLSAGREGAAPLVAASDVPPSHDHGGRTLRYARAAGVQEGWRVGPEGVELSYTFAAPLAGRGDLVVRVAVETSLVPRATGADPSGALRLRAPVVDGEDVPGVRIGGVTGIDAAGRRCGGSMRLVGQVLELRLPAAFVDRAAWPLTLDPLFGTDFPIAAGNDEAHPGVAWDVGSQRFLVVWQRETSIDSVAVLGRFLDAAGNSVSPVISIRSSARTLAIRPAVANVRSNGRFLVAWREALSIVGPWLHVGRCVNPDGSVSGTVALPDSPMTVAITFGPILGSNATASDTGVLLAWGNNTRVGVARVDVPAGTGVPTPGSPTYVGTGIINITGFSLSRTCGSAGRWALIWSGTDFSTPVLRAYAIGLNATVLGSLNLLPTVSPPPTSMSAVDGDGTDFLVAWLQAGDVFCRRIQWNGSNLVALGTASTQVTASTTGKTETAVCLLGPKVLVAWSDDGGVPLQNDIRGMALDPATCLACEQPFVIARPARYDFGPAIAASPSNPPATSDGALIVFSSAPLTAPFASEIIGQRFKTFGGGSVQSLGGGCGPTLTFSQNGPIAIGNTGLVLHFDGVQGASAAFFAIAAPQPPTVACGACVAALPLIVLQTRVNGNRASLPVALHCNVSLIGGQVEFQGWVLDPAQAPCPLAPGLYFSNRQLVTIGQ